MLGTTTTRKPHLPSLSLSSRTCVLSPASSTSLTDQDSCSSADDLALITDSESPPPQPRHPPPSTAGDRSRSLSSRRQSTRSFSLRIFSSRGRGDRAEDCKQQRKRRTGLKGQSREDDDGTAETTGEEHHSIFDQHSRVQHRSNPSDRSLSLLVEPSHAPRPYQHQNLLVSMRNKLLPQRRNANQLQQHLLQQHEEGPRIPSQQQQTETWQRQHVDGSAELHPTALKVISSHNNYDYMNDESHHWLREPEGRSISLAPGDVAARMAGKETSASRVENFHRSLSNKMMERALETFCKRTLSWENVEFIRQVRELQQLQRSTSSSSSSSSPSTTNTSANSSRVIASTTFTTTTTTTAAIEEDEVSMPGSLLYWRLKSIAEKFVVPGCPTEVNVKGESRTAALDAIALAMAAMDIETDSDTAGRRQASRDGGGEDREEARTHRAAQNMAAAIDALGELSGEVITVVIHDIWPRFRSSPEFEQLMETEEMRKVGFTDIDGIVVYPPQDSSISRSSSSSLPSSCRRARLSMKKLSFKPVIVRPENRREADATASPTTGTRGSNTDPDDSAARAAAADADPDDSTARVAAADADDGHPDSNHSRFLSEESCLDHEDDGAGAGAEVVRDGLLGTPFGVNDMSLPNLPFPWEGAPPEYQEFTDSVDRNDSLTTHISSSVSAPLSVVRIPSRGHRRGGSGGGSGGGNQVVRKQKKDASSRNPSCRNPSSRNLSSSSLKISARLTRKTTEKVYTCSPVGRRADGDHSRKGSFSSKTLVTPLDSSPRPGSGHIPAGVPHHNAARSVGSGDHDGGGSGDGGESLVPGDVAICTALSPKVHTTIAAMAASPLRGSLGKAGEYGGTAPSFYGNKLLEETVLGRFFSGFAYGGEGAGQRALAGWRNSERRVAGDGESTQQRLPRRPR